MSKLKIHMLQQRWKSPNTATKTRHSQIKINKYFSKKKKKERKTHTGVSNLGQRSRVAR